MNEIRKTINLVSGGGKKLNKMTLLPAAGFFRALAKNKKYRGPATNTYLKMQQT